MFVPVGLAEALELHQVQTGDIDVVTLVAVLLVVAVITSVALVGEVLYSGIVAAIVKQDHGAEAHPLGKLVRSLPYGRLILSDIAFVLIVALGFVALIVPGIVFLAWFSLSAAVIEVERVSVREAFRRSRTLVRRDFWRSLVIVLGVTIASEAASAGIVSLVTNALGHSFVDRWIEATVSGIVTAPLFALPIVVLYFELGALADSAASSGTVTNR